MNLPSQDELPLFRVRPDNPNVDWFVGLLRRNGWTTAREVLREAGLPDSEANRRIVRMWAAAAGPSVIKGQKGFNWWGNCSLDDCLKAANQALATGRELIRYAVAVRKLIHAKAGS